MLGQIKINEAEVGISEYLGAHIGFVATTKQRYSDFVVNEIDMEGNTVILQDCDNLPESLKTKSCVESMFDVSTEQVLRDMENDTSYPDFMIKLEENDTKEIRKKIHDFIREKYPKLSSRTEDIENESITKKYIIISQKSKGLQSNIRNTSYDDKGLPKYLHFVLYKEGIDTIQAVNKMGRLLRLKTSRFSYAGTKDKRAITTQKMSVFKVEAKRMQDLNKLAGPRLAQNSEKDDETLGMGQLKVGNFTYSDYPVPLGSLKGNRFKLILRNVTFPTPLEPCTSPVRVLSRCFESLTRLGFVNYFGHQRFGASLDTWRIGRALLSGRWAQALDLILRPLSESNRRATPELRHLMEAWARTKDPTATLASVNYATLRRDNGPTLDDEDPVENDGDARSNQPSSGPLKFGKLADCPEYKLILGLEKYGNSDPLKVISTALHRNLRLMYVHAYQSYVWNRVASALLRARRSSKLSNRTQNSQEPLFELKVGDLVRCEKCPPGSEPEPPISKSAKKFKSNNDADVSQQSQDRDIEGNDALNGSLDPVDCAATSEEKSSHKNRSNTVEYITADNISAYTVYDLVLPLPGYDILYPQSEDCLALYKEILEMDGFKYDEMRRKVKDYSLPGDYRKLLARPQDLRWHLLSDEGTEENVTCIKDLQMEFSLPPSCYATILLRELTKQNYQDLSVF